MKRFGSGVARSAQSMRNACGVSEVEWVAREVWLLLVNDLVLGPGEVSVYEDDLKDWTFDFSFDKVLGFRRHPVDQRRSSNCDGSERDEPLHSHAQVVVVGNRVPL